MAISRINAIQGTTTADGSGNLAVSLTGLTIAHGDVLFFATTAANTSSNFTLAGSGNSSGALTEPKDLYANDTRDSNFYSGLAIQPATPDTTITVTGYDAARNVAYIVVQYRGVDTTDPTDVAATTATGTNTALADPPSITPSTSDAKIVVAYSGTVITSWTAPTDVDNYLEQEAGISDTRLGVGDKNWTSGTFDPAVLTGTGDSTSNSWAAATYALKPAATQTLTPSLFTNSNSFFTHTISSGVQDIAPNLFTNSQTFYSPTVAPGPITLTPSLVTNSQTFYSPTVTSLYTLSPSLVTNNQAFYSPTVTATYTLAPSLLTDGDNFFSPTVIPGATTLTVSFITNNQTFYGATITTGPVDMSPALFNNKIGDSGYGSQFFSHYIERVPFHPWTASARFKRGKPYI